MLSPAFWKNRRVAITGHTGFKGSWLSLWLSELDAKVFGYALEPDCQSAFRSLQPKVDSTIADIRDRERLARWLQSVEPSVIFHLAAQPLVRAGYDDPAGTFDINVAGTLNVLEAGRTLSELRALIVVTSDKAYAPADGRALGEGAHLGGFDPYSASKACADIITLAYAHSFPMRAVIATARAGNVIGGGDWSKDRLVPDLVRALDRNELPVLRYPDAIRPWQHVLEPLAGYLMLAERAGNGDLSVTGAWNFGPSVHSDMSVSQVVERAMRAAGRKPEWHVEAAVQPELPVLRINSDKARLLLDWRPRYDLDAAIAETMAWYTTHHNGGDVAVLSREQILRYAYRPELAIS
jgi:CDP-glucose 4,6-dehydratase